MNFLNKLNGGKLIVSCQALEGEPLHSPVIMGKMALAAKQGGANGIRANSVEDIQAIKKEVDLPVIGIIKKDYEDSSVFITATLDEVKLLLDSDVDMIALDATDRKRPNNEILASIVHFVRENAPNMELMADVSTLEEAIEADRLGFDCVSTTLVGYTDETKGQSLFDQDFHILREMKDKVSIPVVAEGKLQTPELARQAVEKGADFVVVGSAITRPQLITQTFEKAIHPFSERS
ncbi:N-acylglucosamine-6-phosphate 2-epimerase [Pelagirhabdus alkalitolerans]|uniref:Putative N-acetylmannosamine-6-phosphate 2-epimerase n=1 Tax=Pelagirhabdus alkalitolerans TaxID=1612202 RepID=A0A1G6LGU3_9BACI|nr:N-acetylmannosamine-6-phosphate 2-epimerase [Pelagirhabdus alkalitolerans]SDC42424.1 N-acylglucosamine-6-phosphate 2-epimerase [Pelagirhabdus alkalitolerans]